MQLRVVLSLTKSRLSAAVAFSATAGYILQSGTIDYETLFVIGGVFFLAGCAASLNQIQERQLDAQMQRTHNRPIPAGQISSATATIICLILFVAGSLLLLNQGIIPWLLGVLTILLYNGLYTPLKKQTTFAVIPGALVGAIPPIIGWTAAGGTMNHPSIMYLATVLFLWQIPHFWLLIMRYGKQYEEAGFKSISYYLDDKQIRRMVFYWIIVSSTFVAGYPLFDIHLKLIYGLILVGLNIVFIVVFYLLLFNSSTREKLKPAFILTKVFLSIIMLLLIMNAIL